MQVDKEGITGPSTNQHDDVLGYNRKVHGHGCH
jgi:hypothetical protein